MQGGNKEGVHVVKVVSPPGVPIVHGVTRSWGKLDGSRAGRHREGGSKAYPHPI
jgi:hypothetical protein